jgi:glycolate oxidase iron-sulfur subunit
MSQEINNKKGFFFGIDIPDENFLVKCMHCGSCLPVCPTYKLTLLERNSPRGRIRLIKSVFDQKLEITKNFYDEMYYCLDCQTCESACPAGIKYGGLVELARVQVDKTRFNRGLNKWLRKIVFEYIFISKRRVKFLAAMMRIYQRSGLRYLVRKLKIIKLFSDKLYNLELLAPDISNDFTDKKYGIKISPNGEVKYRVGFFYGCFMNVMFSDVNDDTIKVLTENGCEVFIPQDQECCGSMHAHNGDLETARKLAKKNIEDYSKYDLDFIVVNAAGCSAFMKEYFHIFSGEDSLKVSAKHFSDIVMDIVEFLNSRMEKKPSNEVLKKVTYHDACHHVHTQKIFEEPRNIINMIPGVDYIEMKESTDCCGSAGIYNIINFYDSMKILDEKINNIKETKADIVLISNPGCSVQIQYGLRRKNVNIQVMHPVSLLRKSYNI